MGVYVELATVHGRAGDVQYCATLYCQSVRDHLRAEAYHHLWERPTWRFLRLFERRLMRRHERSCTGCVTGYSRQGARVQVCGYVPLTARQDLRCYDLAHHRRKDFATVQLSRGEYAHIARAQGFREFADEARTEENDGGPTGGA